MSSRISKSLKNIKIGLLYYFIILGVNFYSRKIFLDNLGEEVVGLNTTAKNLLGFLDIAELGIGTAVAVTLYKPLFEHDKKTVCEIVMLQGYLYKTIASIVLFGGGVLMLFFPLIFAKVEMPLWYTYIAFSVFLFGSLLGYFINYKQILFNADQRSYIVTFVFQTTEILKRLSQILALAVFHKGYLWWLVIEAFYSVLLSFVLHRVVNKEYPYLQEKAIPFKTLRQKYPDITKKIKQVFFHKIGGFVLYNTSPLIIYAYTSMSLVAIYGNYLLITVGINGVSSSFFGGIGASVGNLIAEGNQNKIVTFFEEFFTASFLWTATVVFSVYALSSQFVGIWLGESYVLEPSTVFLISAITYMGLIRSPVDAYIFGKGLVGDIYSPLTEAILNLGAAITLGYYWGLNGILWGILLSLVVIIGIWKPYYLFSRGLKVNPRLFFELHIKCLLCGTAVGFISLSLENIFPFTASKNFWQFFIHALSVSSFYFIILATLLYFVTSGIKRFGNRILNMIKLFVGS